MPETTIFHNTLAASATPWPPLIVNSFSSDMPSANRPTDQLAMSRCADVSGKQTEGKTKVLKKRKFSLWHG